MYAKMHTVNSLVILLILYNIMYINVAWLNGKLLIKINL